MTSLSLFPRPLALSAYSAVSGSRMTLCLAISCSALFACRSPPLLSLCLTVLPLEAGMGQAPHIAANDASERSLHRVEARPVGRRPLHRDAGRLPGRGDRPGERLVARRVGGELAGQDLAAPPVQDVQPVRVGVGVDPAEDRPAGVGYRFVLHASLRSFRARLDRADGTLTGRDRMRLFGSAVSLHAPIRSCGGLGSPRPARDMSGNEGSPVGASGMWGHRAVRI